MCAHGVRLYRKREKIWQNVNQWRADEGSLRRYTEMGGNMLTGKLSEGHGGVKVALTSP